MDRDRHLVDWLHAGNYHGMWGAVVMAIYSGVAVGFGFPVPLRGHPALLMLIAVAVGFLVGKAVGAAVLGASGQAAQTVYMPSAKGSYTMQHSHIDALEAEIDAEALLKGTHSGVDGVYDADPRLVPTAKKYDEVSYIEVMTKDLKVMDATAIAFCRDNKIPIVVFDMSAPGSLQAILRGDTVGTIVHDV